MGKVHPKFNKKLPKNYKSYFDPKSDKEFKKRHKRIYKVCEILGILAIGVPLDAYMLIGAFMGKNMNCPLALLGLLGAFIFATGLFNIVAAFVEQYLGHWVTIICLSVGFIISLTVLLILP